MNPVTTEEDIANATAEITQLLGQEKPHDKIKYYLTTFIQREKENWKKQMAEEIAAAKKA